jgi:hypothetical protein
MRVMAALTIMAAINVITPMIIFKGKPNGQIACRELPNLDQMSIYECQDALLKDKHCMLVWVDEVLGTYLAANLPPDGMQPVLLLDSY